MRCHDLDKVADTNRYGREEEEAQMDKNRARAKQDSHSDILKYKSNIGFQYKTNVNKMMLTLTSIFLQKSMLTYHTLTSVF